MVPKRLTAILFAAVLALLIAGGSALAAPAVNGAATEMTAEDEPDVHTDIVGGEPVPGGKYPFVAALRDTRRSGGAFGELFCGGTLVDQNSVLTAAHCVGGKPTRALKVTIGRADLRTNAGQTRGVSRVVYHPDVYCPNVCRYDVAVLQLSSPISGITPVKLPTVSENSYEEPGRSLTVAGYGVKEGGGRVSRMREAEVPVKADSTAKDAYGSWYRPAIMVAAGREGKDSCQGDSGGPLFERTDSGTYQVGITSFGKGCGRRGYPGVSAEVNASEIRPFIVAASALND